MFSTLPTDDCCKDHIRKSNVCHQSQLDLKFHFQHSQLTGPHTIPFAFVSGQVKGLLVPHLSKCFSFLFFHVKLSKVSQVMLVHSVEISWRSDVWCSNECIVVLNGAPLPEIFN